MRDLAEAVPPAPTNVLIVHDSLSAARQLALALNARGRCVDCSAPSDIPYALRPSTDVVVFGMPLSGKAVAAMTRELRTHAARGQLRVLAVVHDSEAGLADLDNVPIDDYILAPADLGALSGHIELALRRFEAEGVARRHDGAERLRALHSIAWERICETMASEFENFVGDRFTTTSAALDEPHVRVTLPLASAAEHLVWLIQLEMSAADAARLARRLIGADVDLSIIEDAAREAVNTVAGAVKRAAFASAIVLTTGMPRGPTASIGDPPAPCTTRTGAGIVVRLSASLIDAFPVQIALSDLQEGGVIASDVRVPSGCVLVPAGTSVTVPVVERLRAHFDGRVRVDVIAA